MVISPMVHALRELGGGRCIIKLRQKTSQPFEIPGTSNGVTVVDEHISLHCTRYREVGESGVFVFVTDVANVWVHAEDIFAVFSPATNVVQ